MEIETKKTPKIKARISTNNGKVITINTPAKKATKALPSPLKGQAPLPYLDRFASLTDE